MGILEQVRKLITLAYHNANDTYGHRGELDMIEFEDDGPTDDRLVISHFAETWDQCERDLRSENP